MTIPEPILLAWSGGKDSALALEWLQESEEFQVAELLTTVTEGYERISMHGVRGSLLHRQAAALDLPVRVVHIPPDADGGAYDARMQSALEDAMDRHGVRAVAFGDIFLEDVRAYREERLARVGMTAIFPLWGRSTRELAEHFTTANYRAVLTCVDTSQADASLAGRDYDRFLLDDLPPSVDPCGERGEFHTFVYAGPIFRSPIAHRKGGTVLREDRFLYCDLLEA